VSFNRSFGLILLFEQESARLFPLIDKEFEHIELSENCALMNESVAISVHCAIQGVNLLLFHLLHDLNKTISVTLLDGLDQ